MQDHIPRVDVISGCLKVKGQAPPWTRTRGLTIFQIEGAGAHRIQCFWIKPTQGMGI